MISFQVNFSQELWKGILVFCRLGSALMTYPGMGDVYVPVRLRLALALVCSYLVSMVLPLAPMGVDMTLPWLALKSIAQEIMVGISAGLLVRLLFLALETVGTVWGMQTGLAQALLFQPMFNQAGSLWGHFLSIYALALLFVSDTHHLFLRGLAHSFQSLTLGAPSLSSASWWTLFHHVGVSSLELALTLSTPLLGAGLVFYTALGLLNRIMPHIQVFFIIQPLQILLGFLLISLLLTEGLTLFLSHVIHLQKAWSQAYG